MGSSGAPERISIDAAWSNDCARAPMPPAMTRLTPRSFSHGGRSPGWCSGAVTSVDARRLLRNRIDVHQGKSFRVPEVAAKASAGNGNGNSHFSNFPFAHKARASSRAASNAMKASLRGFAVQLIDVSNTYNKLPPNRCQADGTDGKESRKSAAAIDGSSADYEARRFLLTAADAFRRLAAVAKTTALPPVTLTPRFTT